MCEHAEGEGASPDERQLSFVREVIRAEDDTTEDGIDQQLSAAAKELGIEIDLASAPIPGFFRPSSSNVSRKSLESLESRASHSTGVTSVFSDASREPNYTRVGRKDYDAYVPRGKAGARHSISLSPAATPSQSAFSPPLASAEAAPKRHSRLIRGLSMLRLGRNDSSISLSADGCPHCPQNSRAQRRAVHKLPCGHRLCTQALRTTIRSAGERGAAAAPSCCGVSIPRSLMEHVMPQSEQTDILASRTSSTTSDVRLYGSRRPSMVDDSQRADILLPPVSPVDAQETLQLREQQEAQCTAFLAWIERQRATLSAQHKFQRQALKDCHESLLEDFEDSHAAAISEAEDKQVAAEAELRAAHAKELQDTATALKHMEAYCAGTYSNGTPHHRVVTAQSLAELEKTRRIREQMDIKHSSAINVLRGEQGRRIRTRQQRLERELNELRQKQRMEELGMERRISGELEALEQFITDKRVRLQYRWQMQVIIEAGRAEQKRRSVLEEIDRRDSRLPEPPGPYPDAETILIDGAKRGVSASVAVPGVA